VKGDEMKLVMICYNEALDNEVIEILEQAGIKGYTKWTKVKGKGNSSEPHLLSHIWPKANNVLFTAVSDEITVELLESIRKLKTKAAKEGIKAFLWSIEQIT
jgi:nitrogen regulatory protein PII